MWGGLENETGRKTELAVETQKQDKLPKEPGQSEVSSGAGAFTCLQEEDK